MNQELAGCARCAIQTKDRLCQTEDGKSPTFCPTKNYQAVVDAATEELKKPDILEFARQASMKPPPADLMGWFRSAAKTSTPFRMSWSARRARASFSGVIFLRLYHSFDWACRSFFIL